MKRSFIIVLLVLISLLAADNPKENNETSEPQRPLYEKIPLIRDYRVNQPIKGTIRWGTVGMVLGLWGGYNYHKEKDFELTSSFESGFDYSWEVCKVATLCGAVVGLYQGFIYQRQKSNDPNFQLQKNTIGYEMSLGVSPSNKEGLSFDINIYKNIWVFNELQIGFGDAIWLSSGFYDFEENKYYLNGSRYFLNNKIFNPFYGCGIGISDGEISYDLWSFDENDKLVDGLFPFAHFFAGVKLNMLDFFYFKFELDQELSSFYFKVNKYQNYSFANNFTVCMSIGTKIF